MANRIFAGTKVYICATAQSDEINQAAFEALTWVEVKNVVQAPVLAFAQAMERRAFVDSDIEKPYKALRSGSTSIVVADVPTDAGQDILKAAGLSKTGLYAMYTEEDNKPNASGTGTIRYALALIGSGSPASRQSSDLIDIEYPIELSWALPAIDPEAGA